MPQLSLGAYTVSKLINGVLTCAAPSFKATLGSKFSEDICDFVDWQDACAPPQDNGFPYCKCAKGTKTKVPYELTFSRKYSAIGNNYYCFTVRNDD